MKKFLFLMVCALLTMSALAFAADEPVSLSDTNLENWNHPVKDVFKANDVELIQVDIENKVNFSFTVSFSKQLLLENEAYFTKVVGEVAKAVKFNDYTINDDEHEITIEVKCEKGAVKEVIYNDTPDYFQKLRDDVAKQKQLSDLLLAKIPELKDLAGMVAKNSDNQAKMVIRISTEPDAASEDQYAKNYYTVEIVQVLGENETALDQFLVQKDTQEIVWKDEDNDKYLSLDEWRKSMAKEPYWPKLFQK